jgi:hypothetical protein
MEDLTVLWKLQILALIIPSLLAPTMDAPLAID